MMQIKKKTPEVYAWLDDIKFFNIQRRRKKCGAEKSKRIPSIFKYRNIYMS
jgi:hypothetical protein